METLSVVYEVGRGQASVMPKPNFSTCYRSISRKEHSHSLVQIGRQRIAKGPPTTRAREKSLGRCMGRL